MMSGCHQLVAMLMLLQLRFHPIRCGVSSVSVTMDTVTARLMECRHIAGMVVAVVTPEQHTTFSKGYGYSVLETSTPATSSSRVCVASLSKAFTATLLAIILPQHNLSWDTPLHSICSECSPFGDEYMSRHVTVRDLVTHRVGLPRADMLWWSGAFNSSQLFRRLRCMKSETEWRGEAVYSNIMYALAGHIAEVITGQTWRDLVTKHILEPLEMTETSFFGALLSDPVQVDTMSGQYVRLNEQWIRLDPNLYRTGLETVAPAIAICSTAKDMMKWMKFHLKSSSASQSILRPDVVDELHTIVTSVPASPDMYLSQIQPPDTPVSYVLDGYALGWFTGHYRDMPMLSHYGSLPGAYSHITLLPHLNIGIFSSFNGGQQNLPYTINSLLHTALLDALLEEPPWITPDILCNFPRGYHWHLKMPPLPTALPIPHPQYFTGLYVDRVYGTVQVKLRANNTLELRYGHMVFPMYLTAIPGENTRHFTTHIETKEWMVNIMVINVQVTDSGHAVGMTLPMLTDEKGIHVFLIRKTNQQASLQVCDHVRSQAHTFAERNLLNVLIFSLWTCTIVVYI